MFSFSEIGVIIRLVFEYRFNIKKVNLAHKEDNNKEYKKDFYTGLIFIVVIVIISFFCYYLYL